MKELNEKLKNIKNFENLKSLEEEIESLGEGLLLRTKRAKWHIFGFTDLGNGYVHYLLSDGVSTRKQKYTDLYKYIEVSNRAR